MKSYPTYKKSCIDWLGEIPNHWDEIAIKYLALLKSGLSINSEDINQTGKYAVYGGNGVRGYGANFTHEGNFVLIGRQGALCGNINYARGNFWASEHAIVASPKREYQLIWFGELLRTMNLNQYSMAAAQPGLSVERIENLKVPLPPLPEQQAIADFLDRKTAQIDTLIEKKQRHIKLVREMRDVLTQTAMRSSKTQSLKLGEVADLIKRPINRQDEELFTPIGLYNRGRGIFHKLITKGADLGDSDFYKIKAGDFVISGQFAWEGAVALARQEEDDCIASHRYHVLRGKPNHTETAYLFSFFNTDLGHKLLNHHSRGAAGRNRPLNISTLLREKIPVSPLSMQKPITALIDREVILKINTQRLVNFLREYRTALISEVVTGKIDVRTETTVHE